MASAAEPVESGQSYTITHVDGRQPESLDDFTGGRASDIGRERTTVPRHGRGHPNRRLIAALPEGPCTPGPRHPGSVHQRTRPLSFPCDTACCVLTRAEDLTGDRRLTVDYL